MELRTERDDPRRFWAEILLRPQFSPWLAVAVLHCGNSDGVFVVKEMQLVRKCLRRRNEEKTAARFSLDSNCSSALPASSRSVRFFHCAYCLTESFVAVGLWLWLMRSNEHGAPQTSIKQVHVESRLNNFKNY